MKKRKDFLEKIKHPVLIKELQIYCEFLDLIANYKNHFAGIFNALYINNNLNQDEIAGKFSIDVRALYRFRKEINAIAEKRFKSKHFNCIESDKFCPIEYETNVL